MRREVRKGRCHVTETFRGGRSEIEMEPLFPRRPSRLTCCKYRSWVGEGGQTKVSRHGKMKYRGFQKSNQSGANPFLWKRANSPPPRPHHEDRCSEQRAGAPLRGMQSLITHRGMPASRQPPASPHNCYLLVSGLPSCSLKSKLHS